MNELKARFTVVYFEISRKKSLKDLIQFNSYYTYIISMIRKDKKTEVKSRSQLRRNLTCVAYIISMFEKVKTNEFKSALLPGTNFFLKQKRKGK